MAGGGGGGGGGDGEPPSPDDPPQADRVISNDRAIEISFIRAILCPVDQTSLILTPVSRPTQRTAAQYWLAISAFESISTVTFRSANG